MKQARALSRIKNVEDDLQKENTKINKKYSLQDQVKVGSKVNKIRAKTCQDLELIKDELQQLEDPPTIPWEKEISSYRLLYSFYDSSCETLAKNILGKILVRKLDDGTILKGKIVETESYLGVVDKASATFQGKVTNSNIPMYMIPGTIYVYRTYGMYYCFNICSQEHGSSIFLRAVEPLEGIERMQDFRNSLLNSKLSKKVNKDFKLHELCNGPSKLCISFDIKKEHSKYSMCSWRGMWIEEDSKEEKFKIVECPRIGIDSAGPEWASKSLRFYILDNKSVSKRDKKAELALLKLS